MFPGADFPAPFFYMKNSILYKKTRKSSWKQKGKII